MTRGHDGKVRVSGMPLCGQALSWRAQANGSDHTGRMASPWSTSSYALGVDIGGTKVLAGLVSGDGTVHAAARVPTPAREGPEAVIAAVEAAVTDVLGKACDRMADEPGLGEFVGLGVGTGGLVEPERGVVVAATDLIAGWSGTEVGKLLADRFGIPVAVDNDGNAFALGESRFGSASGADSALCVAIGTGIGGGLILGGHLRRGRHYLAGEFGHLPAPTRDRCSCGLSGHVEALSSGPAMTRRFGRGVTSLEAVAAAAEAGDAAASGVIATGGAALGSALAGVVAAVDIDIVVIGGGVSAVGRRYLDPLAEALWASLPHEIRPAVRAAKSGPLSPVIGAACLAFERVAGCDG